MRKKALFQKIINNVLTDIFPQTSALCVYMDSGETVEAKIGALETIIGNLQSAIQTIKTNTSVYTLDSNNEIIRDEDGTGLIEFYSFQNDDSASNDEDISTY